MQSNSPSAFFLSLMLHGLVVALIVLFAVSLHEPDKPAPKVFVLVAGPGDNYAATAAPVGGEPDSVKLNVPATATPTVAPPAPVIETAPPEPVVQAAPEPVVKAAPVPPKPVETKTPDFTHQVKRIADRKEKRMIEADRRKRAAEEKKQREADARRKKAEDEAKKKLSYADFQKLNGAPKMASAQPKGDIKVKSIDVRGVTGGTSHAAGAGGKALTREEGDLWDAYYALLKQRLSKALNKPAGLSDLLQVTIQFDVAGNGALSGVKVLRSSGNSEFDQAVLDAFASVRSIGATPTGKGDYNREVTFKMREDE
jgi:colicin import membrane protein